MMNHVADLSRLAARVRLSDRFAILTFDPRLTTRPTMKLVILDRDGVINHDSDQFIKIAGRSGSPSRAASRRSPG